MATNWMVISMLAKIMMHREKRKKRERRREKKRGRKKKNDERLHILPNEISTYTNDMSYVHAYVERDDAADDDKLDDDPFLHINNAY